MLVWVHGGPTDQWQVDWRPRITYWWSRGWDVLVVDPRGTTGHGRTYQQALHRGWGRLDVDDTADIIRYGHAAGWSTPESTAVIGGSSGGLTVLGILADHAGSRRRRSRVVPGQRSEGAHRGHAPIRSALHRHLVAPNDGSPESEAAFAALSPIHRAERITKPLLLMHGTDDLVVPVAQSEALATRIRASGGDVDLVVYEGEGHGFRDAGNVIDEYERTETFLDRVAIRTDRDR